MYIVVFLYYIKMNVLNYIASAKDNFEIKRKSEYC